MEKTISEILSDLKTDDTPTEALTEMQRDVLRSQCVAMMFAKTQESIAISSMVIFGTYGNSIMQEGFRLLTDAIRNNVGSGVLGDLISSMTATPPAPPTAKGPAKRPAKGPSKPKLVVDNAPLKRKPGRPRKTPVAPPAE